MSLPDFENDAQVADYLAQHDPLLLLLMELIAVARKATFRDEDGRMRTTDGAISYLRREIGRLDRNDARSLAVRAILLGASAVELVERNETP